MHLRLLATLLLLSVTAMCQEPARTAQAPTAPVAPETTAPVAPQPTAPTRPATPPMRPPMIRPGAPGNAKFAPDTVKPETPVITVNGVCPAEPKTARAKPAGACKTVITRAQFERLMSLLGPNMPAAQVRLFATRYAQTLVMSAEAKKRGFDKEPEVAELMKYAQMQILEHELTKSMQKNSAALADQDAESFYNKNKELFEKAELLRLYVPRLSGGEGPPATAPDKSAPTPSAAATDSKEIAEALQKRAASGEDFDKLQKEAMDLTKSKTAPPPTKLSKFAKESLPPAHRSVWELKPGEVSGVLEEPGAYFVYKMISRDAPPFEQVKDEIRNTLKARTLQQWSEGVLKAKPAELNDAYFPPPGPTRPELRGRN